MKRRAFITLFSSAAAWPLAGGAQTPPKIPRVGYLGNLTPTTGGLEAFRHGLRDLGYVEGQTIALEVRWAEGRSERLPEQRWWPRKLPRPSQSSWSRVIPSG